MCFTRSLAKKQTLLAPLDRGQTLTELKAIVSRVKTDVSHNTTRLTASLSYGLGTRSLFSFSPLFHLRVFTPPALADAISTCILHRLFFEWMALRVLDTACLLYCSTKSRWQRTQSTRRRFCLFWQVGALRSSPAPRVPCCRTCLRARASQRASLRASARHMPIPCV